MAIRFLFFEACERIAGVSVNWNFELTNVVLIAIAGGAAFFALRQVAEMRESNRKQADSARNQELQLRASVLLSLDQRWESEPIASAVAELELLVNEVQAEAALFYPDLDLNDLRRRAAPMYVTKLHRVETEEPKRYGRLFRICGFYETVGYVVRADYVTLIDVFKLFSVSINTGAAVFRSYIEEIVDEEGANQMLYANFRWLIAEVEKLQATSSVL